MSTSAPAATALWDLVLPATSRRARVPARRSGRRRLAADLRAQPTGARLVILDQGPLAGRRLAALARAAGLTLELEYVAVPTLHAPLFLVERSAATQVYFAEHLLAPPPRLRRGWAAATLGLALLRSPPLWRLFSAALCGRVTLWARA